MSLANAAENVVGGEKYSERIRFLTKKISTKKKELTGIEKVYFQEKEEIERYSNKIEALNGNISRMNKDYIKISGEINRITRKIDSEVEKEQIYSEKLKEVELKKNRGIDAKTEYERIFLKQQSTQDEIMKLREEKNNLNDSFKEIKSKIYSDKQELNKITANYDNISPKFTSANRMLS